MPSTGGERTVWLEEAFTSLEAAGKAATTWQLNEVNEPGAATEAVGSALARSLYVAFVAAIIGFALSTSALTDRQSGDVATVKSCADTQAALNASSGQTTTRATTTTTSNTTTSETRVTAAATGSLKPLPAVCKAG